MSSRHLQMPRNVVVTHTEGYTATLVLEPLEPGFGHTIGNAFRRVLLSASLEGHAIIGMQLPKGITHEFTTIPGVHEDITHIILNLKKIRFKVLHKSPDPIIKVKVKDKKCLQAGDLEAFTNGLEILNPEQVICHLDDRTQFDFDLHLSKGRGYVPADDQSLDESVVGLIPMDATFTPVKNVTYCVENTLVGKKTDYEKIIFTITTDGSITAHEAVEKSATLLINHFTKFLTNPDAPVVGLTQEEIDQQERDEEENKRLIKLLKTSLSQFGLPTRTTNTLENYGVVNLADLLYTVEQKGFGEVMKIKNIGKTAIQELDKIVEIYKTCYQLDVPRYLTSTSTDA